MNMNMNYSKATNKNNLHLEENRENRENMENKEDKKEKTSNFIYYEKRKFGSLCEKMKKDTLLDLWNLQSYNPLYSRIFSLNKTNYNNIQFNNEWYIHDILKKKEENVYLCKLNNTNDYIPLRCEQIYMKFIPLIYPLNYICCKCSDIDKQDIETIFPLPQLSDTNLHDKTMTENENVDENENMNSFFSITNEKIMDSNNSAYVDNFFTYLSGCLLKYGFIHGIEYYGSFLGYKKNYLFNIADDFDSLNNNQYFHKYLNKLFILNNNDYLYQNPIGKKPPLTICSLTSSSDLLFDTLEPFDDTIQCIERQELESNDLSDYYVDINDKNNVESTQNMDIVDKVNEEDDTRSERSYVSDSSKSSYTTISEKSDKSCSSETGNHIDNNLDSDNDSLKGSVWESIDSDSKNNSDSDCSSEMEDIFITIKSFPIQVVCMEKMEDTIDNLIMEGEMDTEIKWFSMFMQIIMTLLTYQKVFAFTHNDLHTNNIMYKKTDTLFLYYCYNGNTYKVPTFGKIYKIIDFGRAIYSYKKERFCSDSFSPNGDADTQYNTEPYFNPNKPRIEPNDSFDIPRLACSLFDFVQSKNSTICNIDTVLQCEDPVQRIVAEWCLDDDGKNILYKSSGEERYHDFKLYKMIGRKMHKHTPDAQLERPEFKQFLFHVKEESKNQNQKKNNKKKGQNQGQNEKIVIMNIDELIKNLC